MVKTLGGGHKKKYRLVDYCRHGPKEGPPLVEKVLSIQYDPCRTAKIAVVASGDHMRFLIATSTMKPGDLISTSGHIPRIASMYNHFLYHRVWIKIIHLLSFNSSAERRRCPPTWSTTSRYRSLVYNQYIHSLYQSTKW